MSEPVDLSMEKNNMWLIVYFEGSNPGTECEILDKKEVVTSAEVLQRGDTVVVPYDGNVKTQGIVVSVSDNKDYLEEHFVSITEEFLKTLIKKKPRFKEKQKATKTTREQGTQTDLLADDIAHKSELLRLQRLCDKVTSTERKRILKRVRNEVTAMLSNLEKDNHNNSNKENNDVLRKPLASVNKSDNDENDQNFVCIGSNKTKISASVFHSINWCAATYTAATRRLLECAFSRPVLATHTLTGKPSPAFGDKAPKTQLDPAIVDDIVDVVSSKCGVTRGQVRNVITTKCADENKIFKKRKMEKKATK